MPELPHADSNTAVLVASSDAVQATHQLADHDQILWATPDDFDALQWSAADIPILGAITAAIRSLEGTSHGDSP